LSIKDRGTKREYKARDALLEMGASVVVRSAGSHGPFDLVAVFSDHVRLVQVKSDKYAVSLEYKITLSNLPRPDDTYIEIWLYQPRKPFLIERIE